MGDVGLQSGMYTNPTEIDKFVKMFEALSLKIKEDVNIDRSMPDTGNPDRIRSIPERVCSPKNSLIPSEWSSLKKRQVAAGLTSASGADRAFYKEMTSLVIWKAPMGQLAQPSFDVGVAIMAHRERTTIRDISRRAGQKKIH